jgi:hypothetical protein
MVASRAQHVGPWPRHGDPGEAVLAVCWSDSLRPFPPSSRLLNLPLADRAVRPREPPDAAKKDSPQPSPSWDGGPICPSCRSTGCGSCICDFRKRDTQSSHRRGAPPRNREFERRAEGKFHCGSHADFDAVLTTAQACRLCPHVSAKINGLHGGMFDSQPNHRLRHLRSAIQCSGSHRKLWGCHHGVVCWRAHRVLHLSLLARARHDSAIFQVCR